MDEVETKILAELNLKSYHQDLNSKESNILSYLRNKESKQLSIKEAELTLKLAEANIQLQRMTLGNLMQKDDLNFTSH